MPTKAASPECSIILKEDKYFTSQVAPTGILKIEGKEKGTETTTAIEKRREEKVVLCYWIEFYCRPSSFAATKTYLLLHSSPFLFLWVSSDLSAALG